MAPKKPTMLQRQRALRNQQQQNKQQSSKQLPPKGQTSANSRQARGQRTSTAKAQAANQQRVIARGMEGFVRRGQAMDKLDKAAKGTQGSGTRTAGAGGGLAKRQPAAVSTRQSGKPSTTGGRVQPSTGGGASSNRVQPVRVRDLGTTKPQQMTGGGTRALPPGRTGGALSRSSSAAQGAAKNIGRAGKALTGLKGGLLAAALMEGGSRAIDAGVGAYKQAIRKERGERAAESGQSGRYVPGGQQSRGGMGGVGNIPPGEGPRNNPNFGKPAAKPPARPSASRPSQTTPSRNTASSSGSQRSAAPQAPKPAMPGRKWDDFNPGRGTSKSNNPLLDRDSGGMKLRDRMKQREASAQSEKAKNLSSNFGQDSGYQPQTKVDGSKYADKKPDMKKVNEYDRRKRRYYD